MSTAFGNRRSLATLVGEGEGWTGPSDGAENTLSRGEPRGKGGCEGAG